MSRRRVILLGLDSLSPVLTAKFLAEGALPALARLKREGMTAELVSTMPPSTPTAWTAVMTGAWGSTSGIEGFSLHRAGAPLDARVSGCSTTHCRVEYLSTVLERAGKLPVILKFPLTWPPLVTDGIQVDGAAGWGGMKCTWDLAFSSCFRTGVVSDSTPSASRLGPAGWSTRDNDNLDEESVRPLVAADADGWVSVPAHFRPFWQTELALALRPGVTGTTWRLLAFAATDGELAQLAIAPSRDFAAAAAFLRAGEWSDWLVGRFQTPDGDVEGAFRVKVMELDGPERRTALYVSQVHRTTGFTVPAPLAERMRVAVGPFPEWTESYDLLQGWIDHDTQMEIYRDHVQWMTRATRYLMREHRWDLFATHLHIIDMAQHIYWGAIDPAHPDYRADQADRFWAIVREVYQLADAYVDAVLADATPDDLVVVLGDHGHDVYHTTLMTNGLLIRLGLLTVFRDPVTGAPRVDWRKTRAYAASNHVFVNLAGRDPDGVVAPADYDAVCRRLVDELARLEDPRTHARPVRYVAPRAEWSAFGLYGEGVGDVIFATSRGYQSKSTLDIPETAWVRSSLVPSRIDCFRPTRLFRDFTGEHDTSFPLDPSLRSLLFVAGAGVRRGVQRAIPARMVDVAPTIARYLDVAFPSGCEGAPLIDLWSAGAPTMAAPVTESVRV